MTLPDELEPHRRRMSPNVGGGVRVGSTKKGQQLQPQRTQRSQGRARKLVKHPYRWFPVSSVSSVVHLFLPGWGSSGRIGRFGELGALLRSGQA